MNWNKVDLNSQYERDQEMLNGYSFDTLLLEISCNVKEINEITVKDQFKKELKARIESAEEVFNANIQNIVKQAKKERNV